ncbi:MAG: hypothetical protein D8M59_09050 [Planctomycetes bacterium]|nr:hypothetical protein [Planctomycetota bacterium]NOG54207.1 hypothetical protein [Planctomycetota bacterium]
MELELRYEHDSNGIVTLWVNQPKMPVVVMDRWLLSQIDLALDRLDAETEPVTGFVLMSASDRVFIAGADLNEIQGLGDTELDAYLAQGQQILNRIEALPCPSVACINGAALGGGMEIALACQYRLAAEAARPYPMGLPECGLGILPGWGGTQRLAAVIAPGHALGRISTGRTFGPAIALRYGLVEAVVPGEQLHERACRLIEQNPKPFRPRTIQQNAEAVQKSLVWAKRCRTRPMRRLPAADRVIKSVETGIQSGLDAGLTEERQALVDLRSSAECQGMLGAFFARTGQLKKFAKSLGDATPAPCEKIVVTGNSMTAKYLAKRLGRKADVTVLGEGETKTDGQMYIAAAGVVRQEQLSLLRSVSAMAPDNAVIVTCSPVLGIGDIAESVTNPERLYGFVPGWPLGKSPGCEVIRGTETSDSAVGTAVALCKAVGGVPVVEYGGGPSAMVRMFRGLVGQAWELAIASGDPGRVDRCAVALGFPGGPLRAIERIGLSRVASLFDDDGQALFGGIEQVFADATSSAASDALAQASGQGNESVTWDEVEMQLLGALADGAAEAVRDGVFGADCQQSPTMENLEPVWLVATFGLSMGAWLKDALLSETLKRM